MRLRGDFLVIGSGIAGLRAAISLADAGRVVILTKADPRESNTGYAQGGIAAAVGADDSPELHASDTIAAGDGLCVPQAVHVLVTEGPRYVRELIDWGAAFDRDADGEPGARPRGRAQRAPRAARARRHRPRDRPRAVAAGRRAPARPRRIDDALAMSLRREDGDCVGATFVGRGRHRVQQVGAARR